MPSSPSSLDLTELHLDKFIQQRTALNTPKRIAILRRELLEAELALKAEKMKLELKHSHRIPEHNHLRGRSPAKNTFAKSNNTATQNHKKQGIQGQPSPDVRLDTGMMYTHLHRPLPKYLRPRYSNTKEWFCTRSHDILFD